MQVTSSFNFSFEMKRWHLSKPDYETNARLKKIGQFLTSLNDG